MSFFSRKKSDRYYENVTLDNAISSTLNSLIGTDPESREFPRLVTAIEKLAELKKVSNSRSVSPDTVAIVVANLVGIMLILNHERASVVASKALGFVQRLTR